MDATLPQIDRGRCTGCGDCITVCPVDILALRDGIAALLHPDACTRCAACEDVCPVYAIELPFLVVRSPSRKVSST